LESLKEDKELDYLFPILLVLMGFKLKSTPKHSKGQSQYGKDVIAVGLKDGIKKRFYFEIKGHSDKDIDDVSFNKKDGLRDSILAAKDTPFEDKSDIEFNSLPVEIVTVHNGIIKENFRPQFNGFIAREFPTGGFQDWDIYTLTELFGNHLFSEYLLADDESLRLFKRTLVLLDAPEYDFQDFKLLVDFQIEKITNIKGRAFKKFFATLNLLSFMILHYSRENNNLYPARECLSYLILKVWSWVLKNQLETKEAVLNEYRKLINIYHDMLDEYFKKTLTAAKMENGLYSGQGSFFEAVGYPLRSFEYLNYLVYFMQARKYWPNFKTIPNINKDKLLGKFGRSLLREIIKKNDGCSRPIIDNHSIAIVNVLLYFLKEKNLKQFEINFLGEYLMRIFNNISLIKIIRKRYPELHNNLKVLTEFVSTGTRPHNYEDRSTLLITVLFEFVSLLNAEDIYVDFKDDFKGKIDLQIAYPNFEEYDIEQLLFEKHFDDEFYIEHGIELKDSVIDFKSMIQNKPIENINYRTDRAGFPFLRILAHIYYENEFFPNEWRSLFPVMHEPK